MKKIIFLCLPIMLMLSSCGGSDEEDFSVDCTYFKARPGTTWNYEAVQFGVSAPQVTKALSTTEVDGTEVVVVSNNFNGQEQESFVTCDQNVIIQSAPTAQTTTGQTVEDVLLELDFGAPVGEESLVLNLSVDQSQAGFMIVTNNDYFGKVVETAISMPIGGTTYNDVVKYELRTVTETIIDGTSTGASETALTTYYVAPEVGTIYSEIEALGTIVFTLSLIDYTY